MKLHCLIFVFLSLALVSAQDSRENEESNIPKKILRKYRIRRPVIVDADGNALTPRVGPRLRRIRVKQPQPQQPQTNNVAIEATPEALLDARFGTIRQQPQPQAQALEQQQQPQVLYNEQQVVEPVRVVPQYRKATPSSTRSALLSSVNLRPTSDRDDDRKPAVGTTRNYSHINEDGSFTFGYEGEDGSFKEETRGTDCVVRGKYGYVDPDGVRREFTYVSGNPCDPNNPNPEAEEDDELAAPPTRSGIRQRVPLLQRRPLNQEEIQQGLEQTTEERVPEEQLALFRSTARQRVRPQAQPQRQDFIQPTTFRPRIRITQPPPTAPPALEEPQQLLARAFPQFRQRPIIQDPALQDTSPRPFNFDQELQQLTQQQPEPQQQQQIQYQPQQQHQQQIAAQQQIQYQQQRQPQHFTPAHTFPQRQVFGGANAASLFNNYHQQVQQQQQPEPQQLQQVQQQQQQQQGFGNYRTELVYDPASGQYTSVLVQDIPKTNEEFTLTQRLRAFANPNANNQLQYQPQPQIQYYQQQQPQQQQQLERQPLFERTLYHPLPGSISRLHADAQEVANSPASGQIDAFLRTLNISA
jgi:hypothetical protein